MMAMRVTCFIVPYSRGSRAAAPAPHVRWTIVALYAAYASNMDPEQMAARAPHSPLRTTGWLQDWRLTFGGENVGFEGALATVAEAGGEHVFVVLYDVPELDEQAL